MFKRVFLTIVVFVLIFTVGLVPHTAHADDQPQFCDWPKVGDLLKSNYTDAQLQYGYAAGGFVDMGLQPCTAGVAYPTIFGGALGDSTAQDLSLIIFTYKRAGGWIVSKFNETPPKQLGRFEMKAVPSTESYDYYFAYTQPKLAFTKTSFMRSGEIMSTAGLTEDQVPAEVVKATHTMCGYADYQLVSMLNVPTDAISVGVEEFYDMSNGKCNTGYFQLGIEGPYDKSGENVYYPLFNYFFFRNTEGKIVMGDPIEDKNGTFHYPIRAHSDGYQATIITYFLGGEIFQTTVASDGKVTQDQIAKLDWVVIDQSVTLQKSNTEWPDFIDLALSLPTFPSQVETFQPMGWQCIKRGSTQCELAMLGIEVDGVRRASYPVGESEYEFQQGLTYFAVRNADGSWKLTQPYVIDGGFYFYRNIEVAKSATSFTVTSCDLSAATHTFIVAADGSSVTYKEGKLTVDKDCQDGVMYPSSD